MFCVTALLCVCLTALRRRWTQAQATGVALLISVHLSRFFKLDVVADRRPLCLFLVTTVVPSSPPNSLDWRPHRRLSDSVPSNYNHY